MTDEAHVFIADHYEMMGDPTVEEGQISPNDKGGPLGEKKKKPRLRVGMGKLSHVDTVALVW